MRNVHLTYWSFVIISLGLLSPGYNNGRGKITQYVGFPSLCFLNVSPDRRFAVFAVSYFHEQEHIHKVKRRASGLYLLDLTTQHVKQLTSSGSYPSFTTDGRAILFVRNYETVWKLDLGSLKAMPLTPQIRGHYVIWPVQSPNGRFIAYINHKGLFLMDTKTKSHKRLLPHPVSFVRWLPNGKLICSSYESDQSCDTWDCSMENFLRIIDPITGKIVIEYSLGLCHMTPEISPDGRYILTTLGWHFPPTGLWVIDLLKWETKLQILSKEIRANPISMEYLTKIHIDQITMLEISLGIENLGVLKQYMDQLKDISDNYDLRPLIAKYTWVNFSTPVTLSRLRKEDLVLRGLTKESFINLIQDSDFVHRLQEQNPTARFRWWTWINDYSILCIIEDNSYPFYIDKNTEIISAPEDIWLINLQTQQRTRLTKFGEMEIRIPVGKK